MKIKLIPKEVGLRTGIKNHLNKLRSQLSENRRGSEVSKLLDEMGKKAHELHMSLAVRGHEQSDWIGVHLTPSAQFSFVPDTQSNLWKEFSPPNKSRLNLAPYCVNWTASWRNRQEEIERIKEKFRRLGPIVPEISGKFVHTLKFIEATNP